MKNNKDTNASINLKESTVFFEGSIDKFTVPYLDRSLQRTKDFTGIKEIDLSKVTSMDSAGSILIQELAKTIKAANDLDIPETEIYKNYPQDIAHIFEIFSLQKVKEISLPWKESFFEKLGDTVSSFGTALLYAFVLAADIFYWAIAGIWKRKGARKGSFIQQSLLIGAEAIPIVGLLSFIIGVVLALQAAAQLRLVGADIFLADMLGYAMLTEMGALMTAIIVSGRSGSSIASEVATMKVTEELDALKMMSINPTRYVLVPKFYAMSACMPLLVVFSIIVGIIGGILVAVLYLNLSVTAFYNQMLGALFLKDFITTMIKSTFFGWAIVVIGSFYGLRVEGGAEGVGKATTYAVVTSIFTVILIDVIFSLLYLP